MFNQDPAFWIAVIGATIVKLATSPYHSLFRTLMTIFAAVFSAWAFTVPTLDWLELDPATYTPPVAALLALTGEGFMRMVLGAVNDPTKLAELIRIWRGK